VILAAVLFLAALAAALRYGRPALRALVAAAIVLSPLRGGLLALAEDVSLPDSSIAVNAIVPALVAAIAVGVLVKLRPRPEDFPRPLLVGWGLIALVAVLAFPFQTTGLKLYGIGLAQYLVYPTLAVAIWPLLRPGDVRRLVYLVCGTGAFVAATVLVQQAGIESFIQAATAEVDGFAANRYAGITGSYLHTSAYLGVASVLAMGVLLRMRSARGTVGGALLLAAILSGQVLTYSRSGVVIAAIGAASLFAIAAAGARLRFAAAVIPAAAIALAVGSLGGVAPNEAGNRVTSVVSPTNDPGNERRLESIDEGFMRYENAAFVNKVLGEGLSGTGNARKLVDKPVIATESYYLKLLLETGVVGALLVGGFFVWAGVAFGRLLLRGGGRPLAASIGAAGLGLSLYNVVYPALETQILALAWWLLLVLCLNCRSAGDEEPAPPATGGAARESAPVGNAGA